LFLLWLDFILSHACTLHWCPLSTCLLLCCCPQAVGFAVFAAGALLYDKGHKQEEAASIAAGQTPKFSKWAVLKSTLNIHTGHYVGLRTLRAAANSVMAAHRMARLAEESSIAQDHDAV
jgi:hypothetical protein